MTRQRTRPRHKRWTCMAMTIRIWLTFHTLSAPVTEKYQPRSRLIHSRPRYLITAYNDTRIPDPIFNRTKGSVRNSTVVRHNSRSATSKRPLLTTVPKRPLPHHLRAPGRFPSFFVATDKPVNENTHTVPQNSPQTGRDPNAPTYIDPTASVNRPAYDEMRSQSTI